MLKSLRLIDFKSFADQAVDFAPLTLLVGANASGKSNLLDALRFLRGTNYDLTLAEVVGGEERSGPDVWPGIRGRAPETARFGRSAFTIESRWVGRPEFDLGDRGSRERVEVIHKLACRTVPTPKLVSESIADVDGRILFSTSTDGAGLAAAQVEPLARGPGQRSNGKTMREWHDRSVLWLLLGSSESAGVHLTVSPEVVEHAWALRDALTSIRPIDIQPAAMKDYGRRGRSLGDEGKNISGVLADLCDNEEKKRSLVEWIAELCAPEVADLDFIEVEELSDVMAVLVEHDGTRISARSLSDGTLRFLGLLVMLRTANPGSVILAEEIDFGFHPTRLRLLVEYLEAVVREREIQIIATTHSPALLRWLSEDALRNAIAFGRVPDREGTIMRRLMELPHFDEVVRRKGIDELFSMGWLETAL